MLPAAIFRQYTFDDSFEQVFVSRKYLKEYQIALTFATDYDKNGIPTNGDFRPTWNQTKVTSESIKQFKERYSKEGIDVKVFISIGNRGTQFPFKPTDTKTWIEKATESLTNIITNKEYDLQVEGIDVWYENIESSTDDFVKCVGEVIKNLKKAEVVKVASISPSDALNKKYYSSLYYYYATFIDWVDYQFQNETTFVSDPDVVVNRYNELVKSYTISKLLAGYSAENEDWATLTPFVFFLGAMGILEEPAPGFSIYYHYYNAQPKPSA